LEDVFFSENQLSTFLLREGRVKIQKSEFVETETSKLCCCRKFMRQLQKVYEAGSKIVMPILESEEEDSQLVRMKNCFKFEFFIGN
jgi:hypothetical protein